MSVRSHRDLDTVLLTHPCHGAEGSMSVLSWTSRKGGPALCPGAVGVWEEEGSSLSSVSSSGWESSSPKGPGSRMKASGLQRCSREQR